MLTTAFAFFLSACVTVAKRSDSTPFGLLEENSTKTRVRVSMTASEAISKGLIMAWDAPPKTADPMDPAAFVQIQEHSDASDAFGKKTKFCPKMEKQNAICTEKPCDPRNLVFITCLSAEKLPSQFLDKVDPYVYFWVDNKKNLASTPEFKNNENPNFAWGCPFAYDGALNFDGEVWDSDIGRDDLVGEIASSGGVKIDEKFLAQFDKDGDGRFDLGLYIYANGKKVKNKRGGDKGGESIVRFRFELIKAPGYELRRVGGVRPANYGSGAQGSRGGLGY